MPIVSNWTQYLKLNGRCSDLRVNRETFIAHLKAL